MFWLLRQFLHLNIVLLLFAFVFFPDSLVDETWLELPIILFSFLLLGFGIGFDRNRHIVSNRTCDLVIHG